MTATARRKPKRARDLGVTRTDYERMLAAQGGGCAVCGNPPKTRRLHVDHNHRTGAVRGLLCHNCNRFLPRTLERARAMVSYLARYESSP